MKIVKKTNLTGSLEDYLEIIFLLSENNGEVRLTDIAATLGCSKPSVSKAISLLKKEGLINQERYGQIVLTLHGKNTASEIYFRHKTLVNFLTKTLGLDEETAQKDACKIEHVISRITLERLIEYMKSKGSTYSTASF